jgi:hypothetical protein
MSLTLSDRDTYALYMFGLRGLKDEADIAVDQADDLALACHVREFSDSLQHLGRAVELARLLRRMWLRLQRGGYLLPRDVRPAECARPAESASVATFTISDREAHQLLVHGTAGLVLKTAFWEGELQGLESLADREHWDEFAPQIVAVGDAAAALLTLYRYLDSRRAGRPMHEAPRDQPD